MSPNRLGWAESNRWFLGASWGTLNAPSTATVLGRDRATRRNLATPPFLAPQPIAQERTLGRRREECPYNRMDIVNIHEPPGGFTYGNPMCSLNRTVPAVQIQYTSSVVSGFAAGHVHFVTLCLHDGLGMTPVVFSIFLRQEEPYMIFL